MTEYRRQKRIEVEHAKLVKMAAELLQKKTIIETKMEEIELIEKENLEISKINKQLENKIKEVKETDRYALYQKKHKPLFMPTLNDITTLKTFIDAKHYTLPNCENGCSKADSCQICGFFYLQSVDYPTALARYNALIAYREKGGDVNTLLKTWVYVKKNLKLFK